MQKSIKFWFSIEKIPKKAGVPITWLMILFMVFNMIMSGLALNRYTERHSNISSAENAVTRFLDKHFTDERMEHIYPNAILVDD